MSLPTGRMLVVFYPDLPFMDSIKLLIRLRSKSDYTFITQAGISNRAGSLVPHLVGNHQ